MALLEEPRGEYAEHDVVLHLLLGLVSASQRLGQVLPEPASSSAPPPADSLPEPPALLALLGLLSLRRTFLRALEPLQPEGSPEPRPGNIPVTTSPMRDLLR